jgi:hypothetical protein
VKSAAMPKMTRRDWRSDRGFLLVSSYLVMSLFLLYSSAITVRTSTNRMASEQLHNRYQAMNLAQASLEQLRSDFYRFLSRDVYQVRWQSDAMKALEWVDALDPSSEQAIDPPFVLADVAGMVEGGTPLSAASSRQTILPTGSGQAWIAATSSTEPGNPLASRAVVLEAVATVGGVTKRIRATYEIELGMSDIFRYAYFLNNYGWFDAQGNSSITVNGEVRSNADLKFSGNMNNIVINGDLYASNNPSMRDPDTGAQALGTVSGDPEEESTWSSDYGSNEYWLGARYDAGSRPPSELTNPFEPPAIGGTPKVLEDGQGWDGVQSRFEGQDVQPIPYLGDLSLYEDIAGAQGATLSYYDPGPDMEFGSADDIGRRTINGVYHGPDGIAGTGDDDYPLVLVGADNGSGVIEINGPVVIPGDVIIKGQVTGQGTIYAGRNVHIVGDIEYDNPALYPNLIRDRVSGALTDWHGLTNPDETGGHTYYQLGWVCNNGTYVNPDDPAGANPGGPCQ